MKAEGSCYFRVAHLISHPAILTAVLWTHKLLKPYWSPKPLSVQSFLHSHKTMQSSLICARVPKMLQQRTGQCVWWNALRERDMHYLWIYSFPPWICAVHLHVPEIPPDLGEHSWTKDAAPHPTWFTFLQAIPHVPCIQTSLGSQSGNSSWRDIISRPLSILAWTV